MEGLPGFRALGFSVLGIDDGLELCDWYGCNDGRLDDRLGFTDGR